MIAITKLILRRPVSTFLAVLSLLFFGFIAFTTMKMELLPDMNFPYMIVSTVYPGASPEDIDELVSKPIEEEVSLLSDVEEVQSRSMENVSMVIVRYRYGTNMDRAYDKLKKKLLELMLNNLHMIIANLATMAKNQLQHQRLRQHLNLHTALVLTNWIAIVWLNTKRRLVL